jgi:hypothetical protein
VRTFAVRAWVVLLALSRLGCGNGQETAPIESEAACATGEWLRDDGVCVPAGLPPDMPCPPGEWLRDDGTCIPAGVPPEGCGDGFVHDGDRGCEPILPEAACPSGQMAVPGETTCREIAPCATGRWGDIPVEPDTQYVDTSYAGMDSDGSALRPWTSVQAGIDAASSGAIVAIAEGSYLEDVLVEGKPVRLWGVCPALVEVVGTAAEVSAISVFTGAAGTEVRDLAIRGDANGFTVSGSLDVRLEHAWVHDTASRGIDVEHVFGPTSVNVRASLIERSHEHGVAVFAAAATVEESVIRDTSGLNGRGVEAAANVGAPSTLLLRSSLVERNDELGVLAAGSEVTVEASVIRDTRGTVLGLGRGVLAQADATTGTPATLVVRSSLVERSHDLGMFVSGSNATVEASVLRDTQPDAQGLRGSGVLAQGYEVTGAPSTLSLRWSLIDQNQESGVSVTGSVATVEASVVRDTHTNALGRHGRGVDAEGLPINGAPSTLLLRSSLVERSQEIGVYVSGSEATVEASVVRDTRPDASGFGGRGVEAAASELTGAPPTLHLHSSFIEQSHEAAVAVFAVGVTIDACLLRDTHPSPGWGAGEGVMVVSHANPASVIITGTRIHQSALAAAAVWGAHGAIENSAMTCQAFDLNRESYRENAGELEDLGGNACGCPEPTRTCKAESAGLVPPPPLGPAEQ